MCNLQMAKELDAILDHSEAQPAASCMSESGSVSYLDQIIHPIYKAIAAVSGYILLLYCYTEILEICHISS